ncbi:MAG TPA: hypothetical protein VN455_03205 [Methanotrichaceae archaeon]|nr:hypothetical protein [Methanotrichaceae archaeon]
MIDPIQARINFISDPVKVLADISAQANLFPPNSRYNGIGTSALIDSEGRKIVYLQRRFIPQPERFALVQEHTVIDGDRLDNIAAQYLGDPELFWRICDANGAMNPDDLTAPDSIGYKIRITLPEGVSGVRYG